MFTKKTRVLSALLTACMLISMLACFAVPVIAVAEEPAKGLVDTSAMVDVKTLTSYEDFSSSTLYKITDRAGFEKLAALFGYKQNFGGGMFYLANDIDMGWVNFSGIGQNGNGENGHYAFKGGLDGNGFVIKNLLINQPGNYRVGLFNYLHGALGVKNLGIASGLIVGGTKNTKEGSYDGVGSIMGEGWDTVMENCWSAATVLCSTGASVGGLVGRTNHGKAITLKNCYFLGTVNNANDTKTKGLSGTPDSVSATASYINTTATTAASLNSAVVQGVEGYDVRYVDTSAGYPALAYYKNGADAPYINRVLTKNDAYSIAWELNKANISGYWKVGAGVAHEVATKATATYRLAIQKVNMGIQVGEVTYLYANGGDKITVPVAEEGYTLTEAPEGFVAGAMATMPANNGELIYTSEKLDVEVIKALKEKVAQYNPAYMDVASQRALIAINGACDVILEEAKKEAAEQDQELINTNAEIIKNNIAALDNMSLNITGATIDETNLAFVPEYSQHELYEDYNYDNVWGISTKEDWIALTEAGAEVANVKIYVKTNIDFENTAMAPLCAGSVFNGSVNGMGHYFENVWIQNSAENGHDGAALISSIGAGVVIRDLGVKSGLIELTGYTSTDNWFALAVFAARSGNGNAAETVAAPTIYKCWAGKDVKLKAYADNVDTGYSTFVGRGAAHIDSCYSLVTLESKLLVYGALSGWAQLNSTIRNSYAVFNGVEPVHQFEIVRSGLATEAVMPETRLENIYGVGNGVVCKNDADLVGNNMEVLPADISGVELAYKLNQNYAKDRGEGAKVYDRVYWTVDEDGTVVYGEADEIPLKVTVNANGELFSFYGKKGDTVTLDIGVDATFELVSGKEAALEGDQFTFGYTDAEVKVTSLLTNALDKAIALFEGKDPAYFANPEAIALKMELVKEKVYVNQEAVNKDAKDLVDLYVPAADKAFPASYGVEGFAMGPITFEGFGIEGNDEFPKVGVNNVDDLLYVEAHSTEYTENQTIVLNADIDVKGSGFATLDNLKASVDGQGHTIKNYVAGPDKANRGFLRSYDGTSVKNLVFDYDEDVVYTQAANYSGLLLNDISKACEFDNITFKNGTFVTSQSGWGLVMCGPSRNATLSNITVENCEFRLGAGNNGVLIGRQYFSTTATLKNIRIVNNTYAGTGSGSWLVGAIDDDANPGSNSSTIVAENIVIANNKTVAGHGKNMAALLLAEFYTRKDTPVHTLKLKNVMIYGNDAAKLMVYRNTGEFCGNNVIAENVYTDNAVLTNGSAANVGAMVEREYANAISLRDATTEIDAAKVVTGETVYDYNTKVDADLGIENGTVYFADDTHKVPYKVTFEGIDAPVFYTDVNGKLIGDTSMIRNECSFSVEDPINGPYNADTNVNAYSHYIEDCVSHKDGEHTGTCLFCKEELTLHCDEAEGYPKAYSDKEIKSANAHKCATCGNEWLTDIVMKPMTLDTGISFFAPVGTEVVVPVGAVNDEEVSAMEFVVTYDADVADLVNVDIMDKTCEIELSKEAGKTTVKVTNRYADQALSSDAEGNYFKLTFAVKDDAALGESAVTIDYVSATGLDGAALAEVGDGATKLDVHNLIKGDFDKNGTSGLTDASAMMRYLLSDLDEGDYNLAAGDVNGDNVVDLVDVVELLRSLA